MKRDIRPFKCIFGVRDQVRLVRVKLLMAAAMATSRWLSLRVIPNLYGVILYMILIEPEERTDG